MHMHNQMNPAVRSHDDAKNDNDNWRTKALDNFSHPFLRG